MKNLVRFLLIGILALSIGSCSVKKTEKETGAEMENPSVTTASITSVSYYDKIRTSGYLAYNNEYKLSFKTGGIVESVFVKEGQVVKTGTVMATLKPEEIEAKVSQAEIAVDKARRDHKRVEALYADSVATKEQLQNAESQLRNAEMDLQTAMFNYKQSKIIAPANGVVQKVEIDANEVVGPGNPAIVFGAENMGMVLVANVSDADVVKIAVGDTASLEFDPYPGTTFHGEIFEIAGMATPATGTYEVKILVKDTGRKLLPGFIGSAIIQSSINNIWYRLPVEALVSANNNAGVIYTLENGVALQKDIKIERILDDAILVTGDITDGKNVIVSGQHRLSGKSMKVNG